MKWWDNLKRYFYKKNLVEQLALVKVNRQVINYNDVKTVGLIYDSTNPANDVVVGKFVERLNGDGKTVEILGFVNDKKIESKPGLNIFNKKEVSWTNVPQSEKALTFAKGKYDLFIGCFIGENLPLEYLAAVSEARWRMGAYTEKKTELYDMMINTGERNDIDYFLNQTIYFLKQIKYDSK